MGSDAKIYTFNETHYSNVVVPALHDLLDQGHTTPWLQRILLKADWEFDLTGISSLGFRFAEVCTYLAPDFASAIPDADWCSGWPARSCKSYDCTALNICPFHSKSRFATYEDFNVLHETVVGDQCLGQHQFVGRSMSPLDYDDVLADQGIAHDHVIWQLLLRLQYRGFVVGFQGSNSDGIHGWLTCDESNQLAKELAQLSLPNFKPTFKAMASFNRFGLGFRAPRPFTFAHLSLAFVRTAAKIAAEAGNGILWGNDIIFRVPPQAR